MKIERITPENWRILSEHAHLTVFGLRKPASMDRIDFALLGIDETSTPMAYVTCRELDSKSLYWQFGGAFPGTRGTLKTYRVFQAFLDWVAPRYERVGMLIENSNLPMLKMAMKIGYRVVGIRHFHGTILLEHLLEFPHA